MKVSRNNHQDDSGCNWFGGFFADKVSPFWVQRDRAIEVQDPDALKASLVRYGYQFAQEDATTRRRDLVLLQMKQGSITREDGIRMLKTL